METGKLILMCKSRTIFTANLRGFSLTELLIAMSILVFLLTAVFSLLGQAQSSFFTADTGIDLRNSLRLSSERIALELRNTGYQNNVAQFTILNNVGVNSSDILRFSIPVLCSSTSTLLDANGNPSYWGASFNWGCNSYACMDANADCSVLEYKYIEYSLNASNQLERKVLNAAFNTVNASTTIAGNDIINFQISLSADTHIITFVLNGQKKSPTGRIVTVTYSNDVLLNNLGG